MPETEQPARRPDYRVLTHAISILLYVLCALLAGFAVWFLSLMLTNPGNAVWRTLFATFACMSLVGVIGTALHRKVDLDAARNRQETAELRKDVAAMMYEVMRAVALAEMGTGIGRDVTAAMDDINKRLEGLSEELDKRIDDLTAAWGGLVALDDSEGGNVFPLPSKETRDAAQRLVRRLIQREEEGR